MQVWEGWEKQMYLVERYKWEDTVIKEKVYISFMKLVSLAIFYDVFIVLSCWLFWVEVYGPKVEKIVQHIVFRIVVYLYLRLKVKHCI
jgi:hypothetical protein